MNATISLPPELLEQIAQRAADLLAERVADVPAYLTPVEASTYMRCSKQRLYDLRSQGRLEAGRDGSRLLFKRAVIDAYLAGEVSR